jgi:hypothetical protein
VRSTELRFVAPARPLLRGEFRRRAAFNHELRNLGRYFGEGYLVRMPRILIRRHAVAARVNNHQLTINVLEVRVGDASLNNLLCDGIVDGLWFHAIGSRNDDEHLRTLFHGFTSGPAAQLRTTEYWNLKPEKKMLAAANFPAHTHKCLRAFTASSAIYFAQETKYEPV